jgi:Coenzyme PQQ synthesis protein D (PqqD)
MTLPHPISRTTGLVTKEVARELIVYDLEWHRAHSLNTVAAAVWRRCDGGRDAAAIAAGIREVEGLPVTEAAVRYAIAELSRARLLTGPAPEPGVSRREWLRRLGATAAVAVPLVTSIVAPTAAQAQSCREVGQSCSLSEPCCPFQTPGASPGTCALEGCACIQGTCQLV